MAAMAAKARVPTAMSAAKLLSWPARTASRARRLILVTQFAVTPSIQQRCSHCCGPSSRAGGDGMAIDGWGAGEGAETEPSGSCDDRLMISSTAAGSARCFGGWICAVHRLRTYYAICRL